EITNNIVGEIAGNNDEIVILHSHHDSPFKSPVEDASGCAVVLALAKHFAKEKNNKRKIVILFTAGHFYGSIGTRTFIRDHLKDIVPKVALEITIEHIAKEAVENAEGKLVFSGQPEGTGIFVPFNKGMVNAVLESVEKNSVDRVFLLPPEGPLGDYPPTDGGDWYEAGVPLVNIISNPVYLLNVEDDFEWVMQERLPKVAGAVADLVRKTDNMSKEAIGLVEFSGFKLKMKLIKQLVKMKTTKFGTRPVY
ncbi:MAG: M28 family peptidase, partial [Bacteroidales bacterium]|nr:M28 family peptidase [Bacteroidales bacterium]